MPYITEELYQRLPHRNGEASESICIAQFPTELAAFDDKIDANFGDLKEMVTQFRSLIAGLGIKPNQKPNIFIKCNSAESFGTFKDTGDIMKVLVKSGDVKVLQASDADPAGCLQAYINDDLKIFLQVVGVIEVKGAIDQLTTRFGKTTDMMEKAIKKTKIPNYENKVPPQVQEEDAKKI